MFARITSLTRGYLITVSVSKAPSVTLPRPDDQSNVSPFSTSNRGRGGLLDRFEFDHQNVSGSQIAEFDLQDREIRRQRGERFSIKCKGTQPEDVLHAQVNGFEIGIDGRVLERP